MQKFSMCLSLILKSYIWLQKYLNTCVPKSNLRGRILEIKYNLDFIDKKNLKLKSKRLKNVAEVSQ